MDAAIAKLSDGTVKISREGKPAQTYFNTIKNYKAYTLVKCNPITGRMHQIRITHVGVCGSHPFRANFNGLGSYH